MFSQQIINLIERFSNKNITGNFQRWEPELFQLFKSETSFLPDNANANQRLWHVKHKENIIPKCKKCNTNFVSWNDNTSDYRLFCSAQCAGRDVNTKNKKQKSMLEKYGVLNYTEAKDFNEKRKRTNRLKYNVDWATQTPQVQKKIRETTKIRYGESVYTQTEDYKKKNQKTLSYQGIESSSQQRLSEESLQKLNDSNWIRNQHINNKRTITSIAEELNCDTTTVMSRLYRFNISLHLYGGSQQQKDLVEAIKQFYTGNIIVNTRTILPSKKEIDIFIPEFNLAIEYCGLYWHCELHNRITKNYHLDKYNECKSLGITLLTIFEDEWKDKPNIVLDTIKYKINSQNKNLVNARKCKIQEIKFGDAKDFLDCYHIQGHGDATINLGIFFIDKLVSVCQLVKKKNNLYLNRYATSCNVRGGFSKILNFIKENYQWDKLITFADLRWSTGKLYTNNNFVLEYQLAPDYSYIIGSNRFHKFNFRHSRLQQKLKNYDPTKTEVQNCLDAGYFRIWDCGKLRFTLNK